MEDMILYCMEDSISFLTVRFDNYVPGAIFIVVEVNPIKIFEFVAKSPQFGQLVLRIDCFQGINIVPKKVAKLYFVSGRIVPTRNSDFVALEEELLEPILVKVPPLPDALMVLFELFLLQVVPGWGDILDVDDRVLHKTLELPFELLTILSHLPLAYQPDLILSLLDRVPYKIIADLLLQEVLDDGVQLDLPIASVNQKVLLIAQK